MAQPRDAQQAKKDQHAATGIGSRPGSHEDLSIINLKFEKKNQDQKRLPPNTTIRRRPMQHAPIGNPYAGAAVPKVVYVSRSTPLMAAVKRVRKLLLQVEKRAMKNVKLMDSRGGDKEKLARIAEGSKKAREEVVYVKATGQAMGQALKVGQWFREKEKELAVDVEVKTGSVIVVDDILELDHEANSEERGITDDVGANMELDQPQQASEDNPEYINQTKTADITAPATDDDTSAGKEKDQKPIPDATKQVRSGRANRRRKKRPMYDADDVPEARQRWVKMVEIMISLKG